MGNLLVLRIRLNRLVIAGPISSAQFTKIVAPPPTPTASILKKRRSMNYNLTDVVASTTNSQIDNNTPSKVKFKIKKKI